MLITNVLIIVRDVEYKDQIGDFRVISFAADAHSKFVLEYDDWRSFESLKMLHYAACK